MACLSQIRHALDFPKRTKKPAQLNEFDKKNLFRFPMICESNENWSEITVGMTMNMNIYIFFNEIYFQRKLNILFLAQDMNINVAISAGH